MYIESNATMTTAEKWPKRKPRKTMRHHNCQICNSNDAIQILHYYGRGDIVICQKCGAGYQIKSRRPFRITLVEPEY